MGQSNQKGDECEFLFLFEATRRGYWVATTTQDCPYDVILDRRQDKLERVQCKYRATSKKGYVSFKMQDKWRSNYRGYTNADIDCVALYIPELMKIALIPVDRLTVAEPTFRVKEATIQRKQDRSIQQFFEW